MFVDRARVKVCGGKGGDGCVSFRREKYVPKGGPDGGDGGSGGAVIFRAVTGEQSLVNIYYQPHWQAGKGQHGRGKGQHGARGKDKIVNVPLGTLVKEAETGAVIGDLTEENQEFLAAQGGRGGRGNTRFVTAQRRAPRISTPGEPGEERQLELELKTIADVGLVGYPNAGKSTLISAISDAHPKTAPYPFTTLHPVVGTIEFDDFYRMTVADIPGLIDGAHDNVGLGHEFLRHIERSYVLCYVLDTAGIDGRTPWDDFAALQNELELHKEGLTRRPSIVVANKLDLDEAAENLAELKKHIDLPIIAISALEHNNTDALLAELRRLVEENADLL